MTEQALNSHEEWSFKLNPWITMIPLMLSIFMFALDETISNVALPYMAGTFSVSLLAENNILCLALLYLQ